MQTQITITVLPEEESNQKIINSKIAAELKKNLKSILDKAHLSLDEKENARKAALNANFESVFVKKSIDARHGQLKLHLRYNVFLCESAKKAMEEQNALPVWKKADGKKSVIIVGSGPAGLFGALALLEHGIKPVIIERGQQTQARKQEIAKISTKDCVNPDSNYCFGEGGAGTFSDGKLYTRSNKRGNISKTLLIFNHFGADKKILTDAHPHIGTDRLPQVINNMRNKIIELGGEFHFGTRVTELILDGAGNKAVKGVKTQDVATGETGEFFADAVVLATGHSASDIYTMLAKQAPSALEAKTFAAGVRVEHPRSLIDAIQYHGKIDSNLGAAEYRVTTQVDGRGVYSFCMCPGGFVVPSASSPEEIVVNGMSAAARNSKWSNAAIVTEIRSEDIPSKYQDMAKKAGCPQLAGLYFRSELEKLAFKNGNGQAAPAQRLSDFLDGKKSSDLPPSSYTPGLVSSNLRDWMPSFMADRLAKGFKEINKNMKGFICPDALMIAIETRTSTPVRILRDKESLECTELKRLYPCGEGSGYSGGIVSSAMDGENVCLRIANDLY